MVAGVPIPIDPEIVRSVPTNNFFAIPTPPAVVIDPPLVELVASVAFEIPSPPDKSTAPVELLVVEVESLLINFGKVSVLVA